MSNRKPYNEREIQGQIIKYLKTLKRTYVFKVILANERGVSDLIVCHKGRFIALEVKTPERRANTSALQEIHLKRVIEAKGKAVVVCSVDDVKEVIENIRSYK